MFVPWVSLPALVCCHLIFSPNLLKKYGIYQWKFHEVALLVPFYWVELEFRVLVFMEEENGEPEEKPLEQR